MRIVEKRALVTAVLSLCVLNAAYAAPDAGKSSSDVSAGQKAPTVVDAGNKICPVTGDKVNGKDTYVYKGKSYNLCCPMCKAEFKSNPEKYAAIADKEAAGNK